MLADSHVAETPETTTLLRAVQTELHVRRKIPVRILHAPASPMVLGILRPILFLPEESVGDESLRLILRHELLHLRRHDAAIKALLLLTHALYWFYPVVWWLRRRAELDLEFACDEAVLAAVESYTRKAYAAAIAASIRRQLARTPALSTEFQGGWKSMKERLDLILHAPPLRSGRAAIALISALLLMVGVFAGCVQEAPKYAEYADLPGGEYLHLIGQVSETVQKEMKINQNGWGSYSADSEFRHLVEREKPEIIFDEEYEMQLHLKPIDTESPFYLRDYEYNYQLDSTDYQEKYDKIAEIYQDYCNLLGEPAPYRSSVTIADCLETRFDAKTYTATWVLAEDIAYPGTAEDHNMLLLAQLEVCLGPQALSVRYIYRATEAGYTNLAGYPVRDRQTGKIVWQNGDPGVPAEHFLAFPFASENLSYLGKSPSAAAKLLKESGENWVKVFDENGTTGCWVREETQHFFGQDYTLSLWQDGSTVWRYSLETTVDSADAAAKTEAIRAVYDACIFSGPTPRARKDSAPTLEQGLEEGFRYSDDPGVYETWWVLRLQITPESNLNEWRVLTCCLRVESSADSAKISVVYEMEDSSAAYDFPDLLA
ncbi:MAG: M56 family metallopeptidase [Ruminococcaceae bacterium]|nr:M56 family metallopeptidase [Oscillospiraceae bacterium]